MSLNVNSNCFDKLAALEFINADREKREILFNSAKMYLVFMYSFTCAILLVICAIFVYWTTLLPVGILFSIVGAIMLMFSGMQVYTVYRTVTVVIIPLYSTKSPKEVTDEVISLITAKGKGGSSAAKRIFTYSEVERVEYNRNLERQQIKDRNDFELINVGETIGYIDGKEIKDFLHVKNKTTGKIHTMKYVSYSKTNPYEEFNRVAQLNQLGYILDSVIYLEE